MRLTDPFCRSAKPIDGKLTEYADTQERGLALRVTPDGVRSWTFRYRNFAREQKRLSLGRLDDVSLSEARGLVVIERAKVQQRLDPVAERKSEQSQAIAETKLETLAEIGEKYFDAAAKGTHRLEPKNGAKRQSTINSERSYFDMHIVPDLGSCKIKDLNRAKIQTFIDNVARGNSSAASRRKKDGSAAGRYKGSPSAARQCKVVLRAIYNYAIWQELVDSNPCLSVTVPKFSTRDQVLSDAELKAVWAAFRNVDEFDDVHVSPSVCLAVLLAAATLQRRSEITGMRKEEINEATKIWTIPKSRTKNHETHVVPLSDLALDLIKKAIGQSGDSEFVFPSPQPGKRQSAIATDAPITPAALTHAFRRVCKAIKITGIRPHDLRRTGATALTGEKLGIPRFFVSRLLNHLSDTGGSAAVTGIYDRNEYLPEKRKALNAWAHHLAELVGEAKAVASNVVELRTT